MDNNTLFHVITSIVAVCGLVLAYLGYRNNSDKDILSSHEEAKKQFNKLCAALIRLSQQVTVLEERQKLQNDHAKEALVRIEQKVEDLDDIIKDGSN